MKRILLLFLLICAVVPVHALDAGDDDVFVRIVDSGASLCCVVRMPGDPNDTYMIYDAGNYPGDGMQAFDNIAEIIEPGATIELLVLSHSDADHIGAVGAICDAYTVKRVIRTGYQRSTTTWTNADQAVTMEDDNEGCIDIDLSYFEYPPGATYRFGDAMVQMVSGFHEPPEDWDIDNQSEERNAGSVVVRVIYKGKSVLFCDDAVGRHSGQVQDTPIAAEKYMIGNAEVIGINSDVLIAPHHGADNGSSTAFIQAVSPEFVVFSAGHKHEHPRAAAAQRYLDAGIQAANMCRTDLKDDEGGEEWDLGSVAGMHDPVGDDDVDIVLRESGQVEVEYRSQANQQYHEALAPP